MSEHPILFTGPMVRAILDGSKTVTRRVVKPQPTHTLVEPKVGLTVGMDPADDGGIWYDTDGVGPGRPVRPRIRIGDRLWVRETWQYLGRRVHIRGGETSCESRVRYRADGDDSPPVTIPGDHKGPPQRLPDDPYSAEYHRAMDRYWNRWRPSIHMPRWASRITLEVTDVAVERVQEITTADILAEGTTVPTDGEGHVLWRLSDRNPAGKVPASYLPHGRLHPGRPPVTQDEVLRAHFADLWDSINGKRAGCTWGENPWCWVVRFRVVQP